MNEDNNKIMKSNIIKDNNKCDERAYLNWGVFDKMNNSIIIWLGRALKDLQVKEAQLDTENARILDYLYVYQRFIDELDEILHA